LLIVDCWLVGDAVALGLVHLGVKVCYPVCIGLRLFIGRSGATLADSINRLKPPSENHRKARQKERARREGHEGWAGPVKTFRKLAMLKTTPLACKQKAT
jgi:hypothetical protein